MHITVHVRPEASTDRQSRDRRAGTVPQELSDITSRFGVRLEPMHSSADDPSLERHFLIEVPDLPTAERMLAELRTAAGVEAAYVKPAAELP